MKPGSDGTMRRVWMAVFVAGTVLRIAFIWRPTDYRLLNAWRDCDYTSIARSFYTEGMNILYPRVDWRGDTPGFVEMEFPVIPWVAALLYHVVGYHEVALRLLSAVCSVLSLFAFASLARRLLPPAGALVATTLFSANGLLFALSGAIQPEPLQLLLTIVTASALYRWFHSGSNATLLLASASTAMAILAKSPAAYLGLFLAFFVLRRLRMRAFTSPIVYVSAVVALVPPLIWYSWAHNHYLSTGLSLGVSNETHFLSWDLLVHPWGWLWGNIIAEAINVFAVSGFLLAALAFFQPWRKLEFTLSWYLSVLVFYAVAADTSGDTWAYYYHSLSIPPACLLMGWGYLATSQEFTWVKRLHIRESIAAVLRVGVVATTIIGMIIWGGQREYRTFVASGLEPFYRCSIQLREHVPPEAKIVVRGGTRFDEHGHSVAYNASMVFTWMNRKGFNYAEEDYSEEMLRSLAQRGGRFWLAGPGDKANFAVYEKLSQKCINVAHCEDFDLFDLFSLVDPGQDFRR